MLVLIVFLLVFLVNQWHMIKFTNKYPGVLNHNGDGVQLGTLIFFSICFILARYFGDSEPLSPPVVDFKPVVPTGQ